MSGKMVESQSDICDVAETKDKSVLLVTVREGISPGSSLPVVLRRMSEDGKVVLALEQVGHGGFRKIEPKPRNDDNDVQSFNSADTRNRRLLESKSTRRGVRICPSCRGRVGYRSKFCKHCLFSCTNSNIPSTVKRKRVKQQSPKMHSKQDKKPRIVGVDIETSEVSVNDFEVQMSCMKSDQTVVYDSVDISTVETIDPFSETTNALSFGNETPRPVSVDNDHHLYETEMQAEDNQGNEETCLGSEPRIVQEEQGHSHKEINNPNMLVQHFDHKISTEESKLCGGYSVSTAQLVSERYIVEIVGRNPGRSYQNVELEQESNNLTSDVRHCITTNDAVNDERNVASDIGDMTNNAGYLADDAEKLAGDVGSVVNNLEDQTNTNSSGKNEENLTENIQGSGNTRDEDGQYNPSQGDVLNQENGQNFVSDLNDGISENEESNSSVLTEDTNSIGFISVTTSDNQMPDRKERNNPIASSTLENTFVFENTDVNGAATITSEVVGEDPANDIGEKEGSENQESMKRTKKENIAQQPFFGKKKSSVQFVRIEPKPLLQPNEEDASSKKTKRRVAKQNRLLSSNATRRGVMLCPLCQKDVGCRSRVCKYCKVAINLCPTKLPTEHKNLLAVELCKETCPEYTVFSVKKTLNASEERCFVTEKVRTTSEGKLKTHSCDCAGSNPMEKPCEHVLSLCRGQRVTQAKNTILKPSKIDSLPIDFTFKFKLGELWEKFREKQFPLVQQVCQNTLVVFDFGSNVQSNTSSCVHVRFEKIRRRNVNELHIFCSGKTCSLWNEASEGEKDVLVTCIHYCVSLWAIASDVELQKYFKIFLEATQVYLHSEVFESKSILKD